MTREHELPEIEQIFLSATATDCRDYRLAIRDVVEHNIPTAKIFLQEKWAENAGPAVDACKHRLMECDGYIGLFGFRYGHIAPGQTISITHQEFLWAVNRWAETSPPIFILRPQPGSDAERFLQAEADKCFAGQSADVTATDKAGQTGFLNAVTAWANAGGRILDFYNTSDELRNKALSSIQNWNLRLYKSAYLGRRQANGDIPRDELGRIGRGAQLTAQSDARKALRKRAGERAVAFLVHGPENHGQLEFIEYLRSGYDDWNTMQVFHGQASELDSAESLICWLCGQLNESLQEAPTVTALARRLAARFTTTSVVVLLRTLGREDTRLELFQRRFWAPLADALTAACTDQKGRLYCFIADQRALPEPPPPFVRTTALTAPDVDYHDLLALPALGPLDEDDVSAWLDSLNATAGLVLDEDHRDAIAADAVQSGGHPRDVYNRLNLNGFWKSPR